MRPVIVTTKNRGVFFGYAAEEHNDAESTIRLSKMRNCIYWTSSVGGVFGLAQTGPLAGCQIGASVPSATLLGVTSVTECTPKAAETWESFPCVR
jgi:hypothetical protein